MKLKSLTLLLLFIGLSAAHAQRGTRIAYVDMDYILQNVPEYQQASQMLDERVNEWKAEIDQKFSEIEIQKEALEKEKVFLTPQLIKEKQEEIHFVEQQIIEYQQKRFGPGGDLEIQKKQLVQPVQDQVFTAVQDIALRRQYDLVLDKSSDITMLYSAKKYDISDLILRIIKRNAKIDAQGNEIDETIDEIIDETDPATLSRQELIEKRRDDRLKALENRKAAIEAQRAERQKAFDERRQQLLDQREARRTGKTVAQIRAEREGKSLDSLPQAETPVNNKRQQLEQRKQEAEKLKEERTKALEERRQQLLDEREARRTGKTVEQIKAERAENLPQEQPKDTLNPVKEEINKVTEPKKEAPKENAQTDRQKRLEARKKVAEEERQKRIKEFEERRKKLKEEKEKKRKEKENNNNG